VRFASIVLLAVGLSMDAMAVAAARGLAVRRLLPRHAVLVALFFGGFQALMPALGWLIGSSVGTAIAAWDHWIVFALLAGIGGKMIHEGLSHDDADADAGADRRDPFALRVLLLLAIATSIDALAAGVTLPLMHAPLLLSIATIGVVTAVLSAIGLVAGRHFGARIGPRLDIVGGLVLIGLGVKTPLEHLGYL
jgi:putative Mn2+ efflux pump MntP